MSSKSLFLFSSVLLLCLAGLPLLSFASSMQVEEESATKSCQSGSSMEEDGVCISQQQDQQSSSSSTSSSSSSSSSYSPLDECGLYMAPSTLGEGANLGMYIGSKPVAANTVLQSEIVIPLLFRDFEDTIYWSEYKEGEVENNPNAGDTNRDDGSLWHRYIWEGYVASIESYDVTNPQDQRAVFVPGIGCTINSILDMKNIDSTHGSTYDTAGLARSDPSAGAFTPYHSSVTTSVVDIQPGHEIFTDYGDEWIPDIPGAQVTLNHVMDEAEEFLRDDYYPFVQKHQLSPRLVDGLWNFTRDFPSVLSVENKYLKHTLQSSSQQQSELPIQSQTISVLPRSEFTWHQIQTKLEEFYQQEINTIKNKLITKAVMNSNQNKNDNGNNEEEDDDDDESAARQYPEETSVIRYFIRQLGKRSLTWLQQNGRCSDHMRPGVSQIPHAGRGAFATRLLPKGTIVGYSPLIHVGVFGQELYNIPYKFDENENDENKGNNYNKSDLVINYSFGHPDSDILLTPYGSMVNYINHAPTTANNNNTSLTANVKVVWPLQEMIAHKPDWLNKDSDFLSNTIEKIGLSFDYIALRDIEEGEEILLDYGAQWEQAWQSHLEGWEPPKDSNNYVHSSQWNKENHSMLLRTQSEQETNPYPSNLITVCIPSYRYDPIQQQYYFVELDSTTDYDSIDRAICTVLERHSNNVGDLYTVEMELTVDDGNDNDSDDHDNEEDNPNNNKEKKIIRVLNFPRNHIIITDRVMSQDWHLPNTFRHWIGIPDDIFPDLWRNLLADDSDDDDDDDNSDDDDEERLDFESDDDDDESGDE